MSAIGPDILELIDFNTSIHCHAVRKLRQLRQGGLSDADLEITAGIMAQRLNLDAPSILAESKFPGPTSGYPFLASAWLKANKRSDDHA